MGHMANPSAHAVPHSAALQHVLHLYRWIATLGRRCEGKDGARRVRQHLVYSTKVPHGHRQAEGGVHHCMIQPPQQLTGLQGMYSPRPA